MASIAPNEIFHTCHPKLTGPFQGANAVRPLQGGRGIEIGGEVLTPVNDRYHFWIRPRRQEDVGWDEITMCQAGWYPAHWEGVL
jgi:hypothetical protein